MNSASCDNLLMVRDNSLRDNTLEGNCGLAIESVTLPTTENRIALLLVSGNAISSDNMKEKVCDIGGDVQLKENSINSEHSDKGKLAIDGNNIVGAYTSADNTATNDLVWQDNSVGTF